MKKILCILLIATFSASPSALMAAFATSRPKSTPTPEATPNTSGTPTASATPLAIPPNVDVIKIKTSNKENEEIPFYVRPPAGYDPTKKGKIYRLLFICPSIHGDAINVLNRHSLIPVADANGWFVVSPTFNQSGRDAHDRSKMYYYPEEFSGKAVLDALDQIAAKYPVDINHLLLAGLSGGAQFVHRFALWAPERVTAIAITSCSWFDDPNAGAARFAWLVSIGDSDPTYENTLDFVSKLKAVGALPFYKIYFGMDHGCDSRASQLNANFLTFYDKLTSADLGKDIRDTRFLDRNKRTMAMTVTNMPFVGDSQEKKYYPNTEENREKIDEENKVFIPSDEMAKLWGAKENE